MKTKVTINDLRDKVLFRDVSIHEIPRYRVNNWRRDLVVLRVVFRCLNGHLLKPLGFKGYAHFQREHGLLYLDERPGDCPTCGQRGPLEMQFSAPMEVLDGEVPR